MMIEKITSANSPFALVLNNNPTQGLPLENIFLLCDSTAGPINILLPKAETFPGRNVKIYVTDVSGTASTHPITVTVDPTDKINGAGSYAIVNDYDFARICVATETLFTATGKVISGGGGGGGIIPITYAALMALVGANNLAAGSYYLITDFQMVTYIQFSGGGLGSEDIHTGSIEPMLAFASSSNTFAPNIISTVNPLDEITWSASFADREWDAVAGQSTGIITSRYDTINRLYRDYDWRNVVFRRWETVNGSGIYDSFTPTAFNFQDYPPFPAQSYDCRIGSPTTGASYIAVPYALDNVVGKINMESIQITNAFSINVERLFQFVVCDAVFSTSISTQDININPDMANIKVVVVLDNYIDTLSNIFGNIVGFNSRNTGTLVINANRALGIQQNQFDGEIIFNAGDMIEGNSSLLPGCLIRNNICKTISNNINFKTIDQNNVVFIESNTGDGTNNLDIVNNVGVKIGGNVNIRTIQDNNVGFIVDNAGNGNGTDLLIILDNNCAEIAENTIQSGSVNIANNSGGKIFGNNFIGTTTNLALNNINSITDNTFSGMANISQNVGNNLNNNTLTGGLVSAEFSQNIFGVFANNVIDQGITKNNFIANITGKTFTPTASMSGGSATATVYDTVAQDVEQVLAAGVLSYTPF